MSNHMQSFLLAVVLACLVHTSSAEGRVRAAFIIIDVQDSFLQGGTMAVSKGETIIPVINSIRNNNKFDMVVFSLDWHPRGHVSFASTFNLTVGSLVNLRYLNNGSLCLDGRITSFSFPAAVDCGSGVTKQFEQKLWPEHCVQNETSLPTSSKLSSLLKRETGDVLVYKGIHKEIDSYSAFNDNGNFSRTDLDAQLKSRNIDTVFIVGFALDICVFYTSLDAKQLGYNTYIVVDAALGIDPNHVITARANMTARGIHLIDHTQIPAILNGHSPIGPCLVLLIVTTVLTRHLVSH